MSEDARRSRQLDSRARLSPQRATPHLSLRRQNDARVGPQIWAVRQDHRRALTLHHMSILGAPARQVGHSGSSTRRRVAQQRLCWSKLTEWRQFRRIRRIHATDQCHCHWQCGSGADRQFFLVQDCGLAKTVLRLRTDRQDLDALNKAFHAAHARNVDKSSPVVHPFHPSFSCIHPVQRGLKQAVHVFR